MRKSMVLTGILATLSAGTVWAQEAEDAYRNPLKDTLATLGAAPCEQGDLTCITITSPRDHFANDPSATIDITYAVSLATQPSKGMVIYVVGGPGGSGLAVADDYLTYFDADFVAQMDFVFLDQRGTGLVNGYSCPEAQKVFDLAEPSLANPDATKTIAQIYVTDCLAETKNADLAPFVVNRLPTDLRERVSAIAMFGLARMASFEFHWTDLVKDTPRDSDVPILPELMRLRSVPMVCVFGEDEPVSGCRDAPGGLLRKEPRTGGHHFDGDLDALVDIVLRLLAHPS